MGLGFSHGEASWSYGGFASFRRKIADHFGLTLEFIWSNSENPEVLKDDPIKDLLCHSDCDGELSPEQCTAIAPRLLEIVADWPDLDYDKRQAIALAEGMNDAVKANQSLHFC